MIYTRSGEPVLSVETFNEETGILEICTGSDLRPRPVRLSSLKADGGIREICSAAKTIIPTAAQ